MKSHILPIVLAVLLVAALAHIGYTEFGSQEEVAEGTTYTSFAAGGVTFDYPDGMHVSGIEEEDVLIVSVDQDPVIYGGFSSIDNPRDIMVRISKNPAEEFRAQNLYDAALDADEEVSLESSDCSDDYTCYTIKGYIQEEPGQMDGYYIREHYESDDIIVSVFAGGFDSLEEVEMPLQNFDPGFVF